VTSNLEPAHLSNHHRNTLLQIFQHPTSHNIEWHDVVSLLESVGSLEERREGAYMVSLGGEVKLIDRPKGKDIDTQMVVDLRRMLTQAGYDTVVRQLEDEGKEI
jgi:hypothetical protein